jgi:hypothetical protein
MTLYAQVQGIGSCLWGAGKVILNRNREARLRLGLQGRERILGILLFGYPAVEFGNKVEGRTMPSVWNGGREGLVRSSADASPQGWPARAQNEWSCER